MYGAEVSKATSNYILILTLALFCSTMRTREVTWLIRGGLLLGEPTPIKGQRAAYGGRAGSPRALLRGARAQEEHAHRALDPRPPQRGAVPRTGGAPSQQTAIVRNPALG